MTISILIMLVGILIGAMLFRQTQPKILQVILIGLILSLTLPFLNVPILSTISFYLFGILNFIFILFSLKNNKKLSIIIAFLVFLSFLINMMHFPYVNEIRILMLIPILCFILVLKKSKLYKPELSILVIFFAFALREFWYLVDIWMR